MTTSRIDGRGPLERAIDDTPAWLRLVGAATSLVGAVAFGMLLFGPRNNDPAMVTWLGAIAVSLVGWLVITVVLLCRRHSFWDAVVAGFIVAFLLGLGIVVVVLSPMVEVANLFNRLDR